ncbi:IclR family transcriptional regulator [Cucumibacter marinus]|uniref:IclR family transcriptional regulator n=1 Tax=Cucumibacter marinus TaxID=1121252 RepID=UPI0004257BFB|nr:IclR family transcriptional regulator [Cucumibacter marinus]
MADTTQSPRKYTAPALEKGLDILELLSTQESGLSQAEIARALNRSVSEIFRMLVVLEARGYVNQNLDNDRYVLTTLLFELAHRMPLVRRLTALAGPLMRTLAHEINQSVHLAILSDDAILVIGQVDSPGNNVMSVRLGAKIELWRASSGRVILAYLPEDELTEFVERAPLPEGMDLDRLRAELAQIRKAGSEVMDSFVVRGIVNISAPVIDHSGRAIAAMTIPHLERLNEPISFSDCRNRLLEATRTLTRSLGGGALVTAPDQVS